MGTAAIAHLKYDLDNYVVALKRVANLAAAFLFEDPIIKMSYLKEIDDYVNDMNYRFHQTFDTNERMRVINDVKAEADMAEREYQILRQGNFTTYFTTEIFEDQGVLKYAKITGGVVAGGLQFYAGWSFFFLDSKLNFRGVKALGLALMAHGFNNAYESISPVLFEHQDTGWVRRFYRTGANMLGFDKYKGDMAYSVADIAVTVIAATQMPVLKESPKRLVTRGMFEPPGNGMLFRNITQDYISKWNKKNLAMKIFFVGSKVYQVKAEFIDGGYRYQDE